LQDTVPKSSIRWWLESSVTAPRSDRNSKVNKRPVTTAEEIYVSATEVKKSVIKQGD
jgi:hypothetical protein